MKKIYGFENYEEAKAYTLKNHHDGEFTIEETVMGGFKLVEVKD